MRGGSGGKIFGFYAKTVANRSRSGYTCLVEKAGKTGSARALPFPKPPGFGNDKL